MDAAARAIRDESAEEISRVRGKLRRRGLSMKQAYPLARDDDGSVAAKYIIYGRNGLAVTPAAGITLEDVDGFIGRWGRE